jgi:hypothetical protein
MYKETKLTIMTEQQLANLAQQTIPNAKGLIKNYFLQAIVKDKKNTFRVIINPITQKVYRELGFKRKTFNEFFTQIFKDRSFKNELYSAFEERFNT